MPPNKMIDSCTPGSLTLENCAEIRNALRKVSEKLTSLFGETQLMIYVLWCVRAKLPTKITAELTEKEWRLIRFALERAQESL